MTLRMLQIKVEFAHSKKNNSKTADKTSLQMCAFHRRRAAKKKKKELTAGK